MYKNMREDDHSHLTVCLVIGRSVRSTTIASVLQIPTTTTPTTPIIPNRREMGEVP